MVSRIPALAGLVLCGGQSRRMGQDKALMEVGGTSMVRLVAGHLAAIADPVILAPGTVGRLGELGYPEVQDWRPDCGPLGGVIAGLEASPHPLLAVVAVDMPHLSTAVLTLLAGACRGFDAALPVTADGLQPLHAVYQRRVLEPMRAALAGGRLAVVDAIAELNVRRVSEDSWRRVEPEGRFADNINTPADRERLGPAAIP